MDNKTVRQFAQALQLYDTSVTSKEAEDIMFQELNKLTPEELEKFVTAAQKVSTVNEAEDSVKKSVKELFAEIFPALSFYPALGIWAIIDKLIQNGDLSSLDTSDRSKLAVYAAIFFGMVGGKIAFNRIKEKVKEIDNADAQISEALRIAGVQLDEAEDDILELDEYEDGEGINQQVLQELYELICANYGEDWLSDSDEVDFMEIEDAVSDFGNDIDGYNESLRHDYALALKDKWSKNNSQKNINESEDNIDWSVRDGVNKLSAEKGMWMWDAEKAYAEEHNMDTGLVHDLYQYGDEHFTLEQAKKELEAEKEAFERAQYADDYLYSNGGWNAYQNRINYLKRLIKRLEENNSI